MKRSVKHNSGTQTMIGIPIRTDVQRDIVKKFDIKLLEEGVFPHRSAKILTMLAEEVGIDYDWRNDNQ
jgi:hypothetical protein